MKPIRLVVLLIITIVILAMALFLKKQRQFSLSTGKEQVGQKLFSQVAFNDITKVQLVKTNETITLSKVGSTWQVEEKLNYPANFSLIRELLTKIWDTKVVQSVPASVNQWAQLDLVSPKEKGSAALIQLFKGSNQLETSFYIGKSQEGSPGRYVRLPEKNDSIYLVNESFPALNYKREEWLDKQFIHPTKIASVTVKPIGKPEWTLSRTTETNAFTLTGAKKIDSAKADTLVQSLSSLRFNDVFEITSAFTTNAFKTPSQFVIKTFEGNFYQLAIGSETNNYYPVKLTLETKQKEEKRFENYIYLIPKSLLEFLFKDQPLK